MIQKIMEQLQHISSCASIYRILTIERLEQKYKFHIDPKICKPEVRHDIETYVHSLRPEFDYSSYYSRMRGYYPAIFMRRARVDTRLSDWMNKIWISKYLQTLCVPTVKRYYSSYEGPPPIEVLEGLTDYVAKPAHLSEGDSVFVVRDGFDLKAGNRVSAEHVFKELEVAMALRTVAWDSWATRNTKPGVVVEAMVSNRHGAFDTMPDELKIYCVWGRVYFGVWRQGLEYQCGGFLYRDHSNDDLNAEDLAWWINMVRIAEVVAEGTDFIRVDIFVNGGDPVVSEVEVIPATPIPRPLQVEIAKLLYQGYSIKRQREDRLHRDSITAGE